MENKQISNTEAQKFPEIPVDNVWLGDPNTVITVGTINVDELSASIREKFLNAPLSREWLGGRNMAITSAKIPIRENTKDGCVE